jgi:hypothetical protein
VRSPQSPSATRQTRAGGPIGDDLLDRDESEVVDRLDQAPVERPPLDPVNRSAAGDDEHVTAAAGGLGQHDVLAFDDDRSPLLPTRIGERRGNHARVRRVERGGSDELITDEREARLRLDVADDARPLAACDVEEVRVGPAPTDEHLDEEMTTVVRHEDVRPRLLRGEPVEHHWVVHRIGAELVECDVAVVLVVLGVAGVPEPGPVRQPRH